MTTATDPVTLALTGALPFAVIAAALVAFPAAAFLLARYRRAVLRGMNEPAGAAVPAARVTESPTVVPDRALAFERLEGPAAQGERTPGPWRAAVPAVLALAAYAAVMALAQLASSGDLAFLPWRLAVVFWVYAWPAVLAANLVAATDRAGRAKLVAGYFAALLLLSVGAGAASPGFDLRQGLVLWLMINGPATVLLYALLARSIRAVGPLVFAFALLGMLGSVALQVWVGGSDAALRAAVRLGGAVGLGGTGTFFAVLAVGFVAFAVLAWAVLRRLGARYAAKAFSDEMLTLDALVLAFALVQPMTLAFEHWSWFFSGLVAYAAYRLVLAAARRRAPAAARPRTLLLLRVFALGARSEGLFDGLRKHWLRRGGITMIAGPDLVNSAVEPDEFLAFLSGQLGRRFVSGEVDLERRIAAMDRRPDPDGRYRVAEFFCRDDTWQATMLRLAQLSDAVLMDLRSFSESNRGCVYELGRLLDAVDLRRVVFVIDGTTDRAFLEAELRRLWSRVAADSPNLSVPDPAVRLFVVAGPSAAEIRALVASLAAA